jgi:ribosomal protein S18 acetylase RimI-like enzyme
MLVQAMPGAMGLAWPPRAGRGPDRIAVEDALAATACRWLRSRAVKVCQGFGAEADRADHAALLRHGFRLATQVTHLRRDDEPVSLAGSFDPASCPLTFSRIDREPRAVVAATLLATYEGSRDCPELNGTRTADELLAGFTSPLTRPEWRLLARHGTEPVGIVFLDAGTEPRVLDLSYLGLAPAARGRGWGGWMLRYSFQVAGDEGCSAVALSVDVRNEPALRLYDRRGFRESDRRDVYLVSWS